MVGYRQAAVARQSDMGPQPGSRKPALIICVTGNLSNVTLSGLARWMGGVSSLFENG